MKPKGLLLKLCLVGLFLVQLVLPRVVAEQRQFAEIDPLVWDTVRAQGAADVLVVLRSQADLSGADALPTKEAKGRHVYNALRAVATESQRGLRAWLEARGRVYQSFYIVNALRIQVDAAELRAVAAWPEVVRVVANPAVMGIPEEAPILAGAVPQGIEANLVRVHADDVWDLGYTGRGIVVAGADTGYDWEHPALKNQYRGWDGEEGEHDYNWHDAIHNGTGVCGVNASAPCDGHGHGTHTMGTMVGGDGAANQIGMAPGAQWIGCRNMDDDGVGSPATYIECFEFFLAPYPVGGAPDNGDPSRAPHVVNNSWGCPPDEGCDPGTLEAAVEALRKAGIVVVASAGNDGRHGCGSVSSPPAIYRQALSVAAFDHTIDDIASFSSRGPVIYGGQAYTKPDITAPGVGIRSSIPGGEYELGRGTSMAAPHVAGAVALLLSARPAYIGQVDAVEQILTSTAEPRLDGQCGDPGPPNNVWGWGMLDVLAGVELALGGTLRGVVTDGNAGAPIEGARVAAWPDVAAAGGAPSLSHQQRTAAREAITGPSGQYTLLLPVATYTVTATAVGYLSQSVSGVGVSSGEETTLDLTLAPLFRFCLPLVVRGLAATDRVRLHALNRAGR